MSAPGTNAKHGTRSRYQYRADPCRCQLCKQAMVNYQKAYRRKNDPVKYDKLDNTRSVEQVAEFIASECYLQPEGVRSTLYRMLKTNPELTMEYRFTVHEASAMYSMFYTVQYMEGFGISFNRAAKIRLVKSFKQTHSTEQDWPFRMLMRYVRFTRNGIQREL